MFGKQTIFRLFIDVSSSSVTLALVSDTHDDYHTLWYHRERFIVVEDTSDTAYFKKISTALLQSFLELQSTGFATMPSGKGKAIAEVRLTIGAPWSYTIVRKNTFTREEPFLITERALEKFEKETDDRVMKDLATNLPKANGALELLNAETIAMAGNGYKVTQFLGREVKKLELVRLLGLYDKAIVAQVAELCEKNIPSAVIISDTNIQVTLDFITNTLFLKQVAIFDVSGEVIEVAIVEKGVLKHASYIVSGLHALVRDISVKTGINSEHVLAALKGSSSDILTQYSKQKEEIEAIFQTHTDTIANTLKIILADSAHPEHLFIRVESGYEAIFQRLVEAALDSLEDKDYAVHMFSPKLLKKADVVDAKTNIATFVFHTLKKK